MYGLASMGSSEAQARLAALHQWAVVIAERFLSPNIPSEYRAGVLDGRTRGIRAAIVAAASDYGLQVTP